MVVFFFTCCLLAEISLVCRKSYCYELAGGATPFAFQLRCEPDMAMYVGSASQWCSPILNEFSGQCGYLLVFLSLSLTCDCVVVNKFSTLSNSISNTMQAVVKNVTDIT